MKSELVAHHAHEPVGNIVNSVACGEIDNKRCCDGDFQPIEFGAGNIVMGGFLMLSECDLFAQGFGHRVDRAPEVYDLGQAGETVHKKIKAQRGQEDLGKSKSHGFVYL